MLLSIAETFEFFMEDLLDVLVSNAIHLFELVGVIVLVVGLTTGILSIVNGASLLKHKREITF